MCTLSPCRAAAAALPLLLPAHSFAPRLRAAPGAVRCAAAGAPRDPFAAGGAGGAAAPPTGPVGFSAPGTDTARLLSVRPPRLAHARAPRFVPLVADPTRRVARLCAR
jgi:hypothetical protein